MRMFVSINLGFGGAEKQFDRLYADLCASPAHRGVWGYIRCDRSSTGWWEMVASLCKIRGGVVVYNMSVLGIGVFPLLLLKALGNHVVLYPHVVVNPAKSRPRLWRLRSLLRRVSLRVADRVVMISDGNWFELEGFLPTTKASIVYNYVACENDRQFRVGPLNRKVAVVGRLQNAHKQQLSFLCDHGRFIKSAGIEVHFFGNGPDEAAMREQVAVQGLERHCFFWGWLEEEAIYAHDFSFVLNLSRWEGLPLSVMEALYRDRIVLATDIHGNRELVYGDFLFKQGGELRQLLLSMVRDHQIDTELLRAQKQRLFLRCSRERSLRALSQALAGYGSEGRPA